MSAQSCTAPLPLERLIAYGLRELDMATESALEEHLFECASCAARLGVVEQLARGIKRSARRGGVHGILTPAFVVRLREQLAIREYRLQPGESVMCTVAPHDDLVVAHLHAPLNDVQRLDMIIEVVTARTEHRLEDVAFDPSAGEVVFASDISQLREVSFATFRTRLIAVDRSSERVIGEYTFNHSPYRPE
jgi:hypothetical protein